MIATRGAAHFIDVAIPAALATACTFAATPARADDGVTLALRGGLSVASVSGSSAFFHPGTKNGFAGGLSVALPVAGRVSLELEMSYAMRGFSFGRSSQTDENGNVLGTFESLDAADMIAVTVPLRVALPIAGPVRTSVIAGPSVAFEIRERLVDRGATQSEITYNQLRNTDFDAVLGLGLDVAVGPGRWGVEGRYVHGFTNLSYPGVFATHTRALEIATSYSLRLGHALD